MSENICRLQIDMADQMVATSAVLSTEDIDLYVSMLTHPHLINQIKVKNHGKKNNR